MEITAVKTNVTQVAKNALENAKNLKSNLAIIKKGKDAYVKSAIEKNADSLLKFTKESQFDKYYKKVEEKAALDFNNIVKNFKDTMKKYKKPGIIAACVAGALVVGGLVVKAIKSKNSNKENNTVTTDNVVNFEAQV